jgi:tetrapyrrole methylase family protein/MazG family protein
MTPKITLVGLGPGREDEITLGALKALEQGQQVILRTGRHGIVPFLRERGIRFSTLDDVYNACENFDDIYPEMIKRIAAAAEEGDVVLGLPGHPLIGERLTYEMLKELGEPAYQIEVLPGISRADALVAVVRKSGVEGLKVLSADELPAAQLDPGLVTVVIGVHDNILASELKVSLLNAYPPDLNIYLSRQNQDGELISEEIPLHTLDHSRKFDHTSCIYLPALGLRELTTYQFRHLVEIMEMLRATEGCPWDREQDHMTLKQYLIEETYEVLEAIDLQNMDKLAEELGDVLLQVVFHAQIASEHGEFGIGDVITGVCQKMIDRHPHIFGNVKVSTSADVLVNWEAIKKEEKGFKNHTQVLKDVPSNLPALMRSFKVQKKAAQAGFDWDHVEDAMAKVEEELRELREVYQEGPEEKVKEELGDLLFAVVNVCRFLKQEPELALTATTEKFIKRFAYIEQNAGRPLEEMTLEEMDSLWNQAKTAFHNEIRV